MGFDSLISLDTMLPIGHKKVPLLNKFVFVLVGIKNTANIVIFFESCIMFYRKSFIIRGFIFVCLYFPDQFDSRFIDYYGYKPLFSLALF